MWLQPPIISLSLPLVAAHSSKYSCGIAWPWLQLHSRARHYLLFSLNKFPWLRQVSTFCCDKFICCIRRKVIYVVNWEKTLIITRGRSVALHLERGGGLKVTESSMPIREVTNWTRRGNTWTNCLLITKMSRFLWTTSANILLRQDKNKKKNPFPLEVSHPSAQRVRIKTAIRGKLNPRIL